MKYATTFVLVFLAACTISTSSTDPGPLMYPDRDGDGYGDMTAGLPAADAPLDYIAQGGDCNDNDPRIHPGATEVCDGVDNDCNGLVDDADPGLDLATATTFHHDGDGDGYGDAATTQQACAAPTGYVADATDCDDTNANVHPGADEVCDGIDNNCNGLVDDADPGLDLSTATRFYVDADGDGYGTGTAKLACAEPSGYATQGGDCDDSDPNTHPGAIEICDGKDNDCDGGIDGTPANPNQCAPLVGTFSGTYTHETDESVGSTIVNQMQCSGTGSATLALTSSQALRGTFNCHYSGGLTAFDANQTVTLTAMVDLSGHVTGTIDHVYDSLDGTERTYDVSGTLTSTTMTLSGTGSWYPNVQSAVPWSVTFSFSASK